MAGDLASVVFTSAELSDHVSPRYTSVSRASVVSGVVVSPVSSASVVCCGGVGGSRVGAGGLHGVGWKVVTSLLGLRSSREICESAVHGSTDSWSDTANLLTVQQSGHAGVGVISLHVAPLSLPTLFTSSLKEFFRLVRAMRVVLPLGNGGTAHLFVIHGYQGAESDPEKLMLSEYSLAAVLAEAKMCCSGQPV